MGKTAGILLLAGCCAFGQTQKEKSDVAERLNTAATVFTEIQNAKDGGIPKDLLDKAHCVVIVPGLKKAAFIVGGQYGRGFVSCRQQGGSGWSAPGALRMEGGSFGLQIGGSETDVVMLVMNERGANKLLSDQFTLGGEAEAAAGPVGRDINALTDAQLHAEILSWSRSRGAFAGISLKGSTVRQDKDENEAMYGAKLTNQEIIQKKQAAGPAGRKLVDVLTQYSPRQTS